MDKYLVSLAVLLLFCEGVWLVHDLAPSSFIFSSRALSGGQVGKIIKSKSQVRRRSQDSLIWQDTEKEQSLFAYDSVLTMNESAAEIELTGQSHITLNENTMVVIEPPPDGQPDGPLKLRFKRGSMRASVKDSAQAIEADDFIVEASPHSKINLRSPSPSVFEIETLSGEARVMDQIIKSGETVILAGKNITRAPAAVELKWQKPVDNERVYTHTDTAVVNFLWEGDVTEVEIDEKPYPVNGLFTNTFKVGNYNLKLKSKEASTLSRSLHVWTAPKIYTISPAYNQRFKKSDQLSFLWSQTTGVSEYKLEIASDPEFKNVIKEFSTSESGTVLKDLPSGHWFWRVSGVDDSGFKIPEYYYGEFFVLDKPLGAPHVKKAFIRKGARLEKSILQKIWELVLPSAEAEENYFAEFQWDKLEGAKGYVIEISLEPNFRKLLVSEHVKTESFKWPNFTLGKYYWRVAGEDSMGQLGLYSDAMRADLTEIPNGPITPESEKPKVAVAKPRPTPVATPVAATPAVTPLEPPPEPPPEPEQPDTPETASWKFGIEGGIHGEFSRFQGGDFVAQDLGLALADFRISLQPPPRHYKHWSAELETHLYSLSARPTTTYPFQDTLTTAILRGSFVKNERWGLAVNQYLGFRRVGLENLGLDNMLAAGPLLQGIWEDDNTYRRSRAELLFGQAYALDYSYLYRCYKPMGPNSNWFYSFEGRAAAGINTNKNFWFDVGTYLWIGLRWK